MVDFLGWKADPSRYFGNPEPTFERLRKPWPDDAPVDLVETSYFGFSIPEEHINCEVYHWMHPVFGLASGGVMIFRGLKPKQMNAEYIEYRNYQPIPDDITDCTYTDGISVKVVTPAEEIEIGFNDPANNTSFQFTSKAIMPPAFRPTGGHFTQALKTTGSLTLFGKQYDIDSYFTRDRSWGDPRTEQRMDIPPIGWHVGVFGDDLAFHVTAFESADLNPELAKCYRGMEAGKNHLWGYVWKGGKLLGIKSCSKVVYREADGVTPASIDLIIVDENDETYKINGIINARLPMSVWPNLTFFFSLTRWTLEGESRIGWGDTQEGSYETFIREHYIEG